jgi:Flp pilus assembly protein CpaB
MTYRVRNIGIAVALAVSAAVMISYYVTNYKRSVQNGASDVTVLVATKDIPAGTTGAEVDKQHLLRAITVTRSAVVPGAISNGSELTTLVATQTTYAGEQVSARRFASQSAGGVRASITGAQRVVQVPGDANQLLSGTLKAGDHVDVVANWQFPEGSGHHVSRIILRDLLVLTAPDATTISSHISAGPSSALLAVQLQVTDTQEPKLYWMAQNGNWTLELRPTTHAADVGKNLEDSMTELGATKAQAVNDLHQAAVAVGQ